MPVAMASRRRTRSRSEASSIRAEAGEANGRAVSSATRLSASQAFQAWSAAAAASARAARPAKAKMTRLSFTSTLLTIPQLLDLAFECAAFVGGDPLEDGDPFLERPHLVAKPIGFGVR